MKIYRYPGVRPFQAADKALFFGRDRDIADLYEMLRAERLVVLFGKSGYGKSSLLNAGVLPRLQSVMTPVELRLGEYIAGQSLPPVEIIQRKAPLTRKLNADAAFLADLPPTLWTHFKQLGSAEKGAYLLVFDQFEEFFSYPAEQQYALRDQLADLLNSELPEVLREAARALNREQRRLLTAPMDIQVLFAIRSDRMHELDRLKDRLPAILHKRFEMKALSRDQAREAIVQPALVGLSTVAQRDTTENSSSVSHSRDLGAGDPSFFSPPFEYGEDALTKILDDLAISTTGQQSGIESFQLQILCDSIENKVIEGRIPDRDKNGLPNVNVNDLPDFTEVFAQYYERRLALLPETQLYAARRVIEDGLMRYDPFTDEGRRLSVDEQALLKDFEGIGLNGNLLRELGNTFLVRREVNTLGGHNYELSHDALLAPVVRAKKKRMAEEEELRRTAALASEEARITHEKADARRRQRRALVTSIVAGVLVLAAVLATVFALQQSKLAQIAINTALTAKNEAAQKEKEATAAQDTARAAEIRAQEATKQSSIDSEKARLAAIEADQKKREANEATLMAEKAKLEAQKAAEQGVVAMLTVANNAIKQLNYTEASDAINAAVRLEANKPEVINALLEMAFFHNHTGGWKTAAQETATAARWLGKPDIAAQAEQVESSSALHELRRLQETLAPARMKELNNRYFPEMVDIKGGTFIPGCVKPGDCTEKDSLYRATLSNYQLARTETTVLQYNLYAVAMGRNIGQRITAADTLREYNLTWGWIPDHPVVYVSWYDAVEYANWASEQQGFTPVYTILKTVRDTSNQNSKDDFRWTVFINDKANGYRLPTEAEWKFAARGGIWQDRYQYAGSDNLDEVAWWYSNSDDRSHAVRGKKSNSLQLYDLTGNVWEWCWDWYGDYPEDNKINYRGLQKGSRRVLCGCSWVQRIDDFRLNKRSNIVPYDRSNTLGFRVARH